MIFGRVLIFLGIVSFVLTLISNYFDILSQIDNKLVITQLGQLWYNISPASLQLAETLVSRYIDPCAALEILNCSSFIWHPIISSILLFPAAPLLALTSFIFIFLGIKKTRKKRSGYPIIK